MLSKETKLAIAVADKVKKMRLLDEFFDALLKKIASLISPVCKEWVDADDEYRSAISQNYGYR